MKLYIMDEDREVLVGAGLIDICNWWIRNYPEDIFVSEPERVCEIRCLMKKLLQKLERGGD